MPQQQVSNHGRGVPLRPLAPDSGVNLSSFALLDMLSDTPHAGAIKTNSKGYDTSATDQDFVHDDLENVFADW